jgi:hypothetical protein
MSLHLAFPLQQFSTLGKQDAVRLQIRSLLCALCGLFGKEKQDLLKLEMKGWLKIFIACVLSKSAA